MRVCPLHQEDLLIREDSLSTFISIGPSDEQTTRTPLPSPLRSLADSIARLPFRVRCFWF